MLKKTLTYPLLIAILLVLFVCLLGTNRAMAQAPAPDSSASPQYKYRLDTTSQWGIEPAPRPANQPLNYTAVAFGVAQPMGNFAAKGLLRNKQGAATTGWFLGIDNQFSFNSWLGARVFTRFYFFGRYRAGLSRALEGHLSTDTLAGAWHATSATGSFFMLQAMAGPAFTLTLNRSTGLYATAYATVGLVGVVVPNWQANAQANTINYTVNVDATAKSNFGYAAGLELSKKITQRFNINLQVGLLSAAITDAFTFATETDLSTPNRTPTQRFDTRNLDVGNFSAGVSMGYRF